MEEAQRQVEDIRCQLAAYQKTAETQSNPVTSQQVKGFLSDVPDSRQRAMIGGDIIREMPPDF